MLNAIIRQGDITIITELPKNLSELRQELFSSGVRSNPSDIKLFDDEGSIEVQVYSDQPLGQHLGAMLTTDDTLATANLAAYLLKNADSTLKAGIQKKVLADGYTSAEELIDDIRGRRHPQCSVRGVRQERCSPACPEAQYCIRGNLQRKCRWQYDGTQLPLAWHKPQFVSF